LVVDITRFNFQVAKVHVDNQWITELRAEWSKPLFSCLPHAEDGLHLLEAWEKYPSPIPKYDWFLPLETVCFSQTPMLGHIMQDFMLIEEDNFMVSDAGQWHMAEGGITKVQFLTCLLQMPYI
jgi:hypothetical protein